MAWTISNPTATTIGLLRDGQTVPDTFPVGTIGFRPGTSPSGDPVMDIFMIGAPLSPFQSIAPADAGYADLAEMNTALKTIFFLTEPDPAPTLPDYANKLSVQLCMDMNVDINIDFDAGAGSGLDGQSFSGDDLVTMLFRNQTDPAENGVWQAHYGNADWERIPATLTALMVTVTAGTVHGGTNWFQTETVVTVDTDDVLFIPAAVMVEDQSSPYWSRAVIVGADGGATAAYFVQHLHNTRMLVHPSIRNMGNNAYSEGFSANAQGLDLMFIGFLAPINYQSKYEVLIHSPIIG